MYWFSLSARDHRSDLNRVRHLQSKGGGLDQLLWLATSLGQPLQILQPIKALVQLNSSNSPAKELYLFILQEHGITKKNEDLSISNESVPHSHSGADQLLLHHRPRDIPVVADIMEVSDFFLLIRRDTLSMEAIWTILWNLNTDGKIAKRRPC